MPKSLSELLAAQNSSIANLADRAQQKVALSDHLRTQLPENLAGGFVHCNLRDDGTLAVIASSSECAARLRFETEEFSRICTALGITISGIKVSVSSG
jgi:hypothetical protein